MNINQILERYWNAEASLQEEAELRAYFSGDDVAPEHEQFRDIFTYFAVNRMRSTDLDVESILTGMTNIDEILDRFWKAETTLEEEALLKEYFSGNEVAEEHKEYEGLFAFYTNRKNLSSDIALNESVFSGIDMDNLLEKYWNAEASLEEEELLRSYFESGEVSDSHLPYQGMFSYLGALSQHSSDMDIKAVLSKAEQADTKVIEMSDQAGRRRTKTFSIQRWATGLAAVFVMGFAAISVMNQSAPTPQYKGQTTILDEEAEAQEAYEITKEALAFLSKNMNKGSNTVVKSVSKAEKVNIFK